MLIIAITATFDLKIQLPNEIWHGTLRHSPWTEPDELILVAEAAFERN